MKFPKIYYLNKQKPTTTDWKYDLLGQVEEADYNTNQDHSYEYDAIGNRTRGMSVPLMNNQNGAGTAPLDINYTSNALNQYTSIDNQITPITYDEDGNLLTDDTGTHTWDAENRLIRLETPTGEIVDYL